MLFNVYELRQADNWICFQLNTLKGTKEQLIPFSSLDVELQVLP